MKLNRSELLSGFNNKLFEIAIEDFRFNDLEFSESNIKILISSVEIDNDIIKVGGCAKFVDEQEIDLSTV